MKLKSLLSLSLIILAVPAAKSMDDRAGAAGTQMTLLELQELMARLGATGAPVRLSVDGVTVRTATFTPERFAVEKAKLSPELNAFIDVFATWPVEERQKILFEPDVATERYTLMIGALDSADRLANYGDSHENFAQWVSSHVTQETKTAFIYCVHFLHLPQQ